MIKRELETKLHILARGFPVIALLGPRQSGKTTLARAAFPNHRYYSLEDLRIREFAQTDPAGFIEQCSQEQYGAIIDEAQHVPALFSFIQVKVDKKHKPGFFILTSSQNFSLSTHISQSLAGRIALQTLLPLSIGELAQAQLLPDRVEQVMYKGFYPRTYVHEVSPTDWYNSYIGTYIERDVLSLEHIGDLSLFHTFIKLCAGRIGQLLDPISLSNDCGIPLATTRSWLSILEASYIIFLLRPYYKNFNKQLVKSQKLYFYDTGIACALHNITSEEQLSMHYIRGGLMESMVITDIIKQQYNQGTPPRCYFWRDQEGHEIDCIVEHGQELIPIEVKAGHTVTSDQLKGLAPWNTVTNTSPAHNTLFYGGHENFKRSQARILSWQSLGTDWWQL